jgi:thiamine phosphate synthase YjbQ (UPF0047 family)
MRQTFHRISVATRGKGLYAITDDVRAWLARENASDGLLSLFCRHTSASLLIYVHDAEGPDDMPAHIRMALTQTHLSIPVQHGKLLLGTWQGIYLFEHRHAPHTREIALHFIGT